MPTLYNALPAIEALHAAWNKRADKAKYAPFKQALKAAIAKLEEYYTKTAASDAHILAMALHPMKKMTHFKKYWGKKLVGDVESLLEKKFSEQYKRLHAAGTSESQAKDALSARKKSCMQGLLSRNLETDSECEEDDDNPMSDPTKPWMTEFHRYIDTVEAVPDDMDIVQWWGVRDILV
ncbi:hypothetical protein BDZ97DRAFT_1163754 [Flammula alnicola]|nr:hypothetical protein BDZ97DRAFT_1163754 [Flammula alnicola]